MEKNNSSVSEKGLGFKGLRTRIIIIIVSHVSLELFCFHITSMTISLLTIAVNHVKCLSGMNAESKVQSRFLNC